MGIGDAIGDVGVGFAKDMRHAEAVARDADVGGLERRRRRRFGGQRLPDSKRYGGNDDQSQETQQNPSQHRWSLRGRSARLCDRPARRWQAADLRAGGRKTGAGKSRAKAQRREEEAPREVAFPSTPPPAAMLEAKGPGA